MNELIDPSFDQNNYVTKTTLSKQSDYDNIANLININNTCEYFAAEIYFNNIDWPRNNVRIWSKSMQLGQVENPIYSDDEKLHWMISDIDIGFGNPNSNTLQRITTGELQNDPSTYLFRSLLANDEFKITLINRIAAQLNTIFREEVVLNKIDTYQHLYEPDIQYHIDTWDSEIGSIEIWKHNIGDLRNFAAFRPSILREQVITQFELPGSASITFKSDSSTGHIQINDTDITTGTIGVDDANQWVGIYFQGIPINLNAIPGDGYVFDHWESSLPSINALSDANLSIIPSGDFEVLAVFRPEESFAGLLKVNKKRMP